jgi:hypothetical protein
MKALKPTHVLLVSAIALASLVAFAQPLVAPTSEAHYPPIPAIPPYIHMADSFQVYSITAP